MQTVREQFAQAHQISTEDEIFYFKYIKAHLLSILFYYKQRQVIEFKKPPLSHKKVKQYYLQELHNTKKWIQKQQENYDYYKSTLIYRDVYLFTRQQQDILIPHENNIVDSRTNTPYTQLFAQIEAHDMLRNYLKNKIKSLAKKQTIPANLQNLQNLQWTMSKTDLIELIYALQAAGVYNNGKTDITEIAKLFQTIFHIDLGDYNRTFYDIRARKINNTKFLDTIKDALIKRMQDTTNELFP